MANSSDKDKEEGVEGEQGSSVDAEPAEPVAANPRQAHLAYGRVYSQLKELPDHELIVINFDIVAVINGMLKVAPSVQRNRALLEQVRPFDMRLVDHFEDFALALAHTHSLVRIAEDTISAEDVPYLTERRTQLLNDARSLAGRGLIDSAKLDKLSHTNNHSELAYDALGLAELFLQAEERLRGKSPVPHEELIEVRDRANRVILALGAKGEKQTSLAEALFERRRAATKVIKTHRTVRIALLLVLLKQALVDEIIPPLKVRKSSKKGKGETSPENQDPAQDPLVDQLDEEFDAELADDDTDDVEPPAQPPRNSEVTAKSGAKRVKSAVGDGLPGASPTDDEE